MSTATTTVWPDNVIARYLTIVGAHVEITKTNGREVRARCTGGCGFDVTKFASDAHESAQAHAEKCRALPRPAK